MRLCGVTFLISWCWLEVWRSWLKLWRSQLEKWPSWLEFSLSQLYC